MKSIEAIILTAGLSSRMPDCNKLLLPFKGSTILNTTLSAFLEADINRIIIVTGFERALIVKSLPADSRVHLVHNSKYKSGMFSSIRAGVQHLSSDAAGFLICPGDMPLLEGVHVTTLIRQLDTALQKDSKAIVKPFNGSMPGQPTIFSSPFRHNIATSENIQSGFQVIANHESHLVQYQTDDQAFFKDVDTLDTYRLLTID